MLELVITLAPEGQPSSATCSACDTNFDIQNENLPPSERKHKLQQSFTEHVNAKHPGENFTPAAARIVRLGL